MTTSEIYTPYKAAQRINAEGLTVKTIAPQQLYGAVRNETLKAKRNEVGTLTVKWTDIEAWVAKFNKYQEDKAKKAESKSESN